MECYTIFSPDLSQLIPHEYIIESNFVHKNTYCYPTCSTNHSRLLRNIYCFMITQLILYSLLYSTSKSGFYHEPYVKIIAKSSSLSRPVCCRAHNLEITQIVRYLERHTILSSGIIFKTKDCVANLDCQLRSLFLCRFVFCPYIVIIGVHPEDKNRGRLPLSPNL